MMCMLPMEILLIGVIFVVGIIVVGVALGTEERFENNCKMKITVIARVVEIDRKRSRLSNGRVLIVNPEYTVTFLTSDNEKKKFHLLTYDYKWIKEGDSGELTTQGTRFIKFSKIEQDCYENTS